MHYVNASGVTIDVAVAPVRVEGVNGISVIEQDGAIVISPRGLSECSACGQLVPDPHVSHDCDDSQILDPVAFRPSPDKG